MNALWVPVPMVGNLVYAFSESNAPGKAIVFLLFGFSVFAWTIMISKGLDLRKAAAENKRFLGVYRRETDPLALFIKKKSCPESPVCRVYEQGCALVSDELQGAGAEEEDMFRRYSGPRRELGAEQLDALRTLNERSVADQALRLEENMVFLATAVSVSPFLGLLGTVWGVMDSFGGMGMTGAATLSSVAPGIAGALLTTIVGLFVALPSAVGYNMLSGSIRKLAVELDNYAQEFTADIQRHYLERRQRSV